MRNEVDPIMLVRPEQCCCGVTVWLTGSPDAGTSPLAHAVAERLRGAGRRVAVLEAVDVRQTGLTAEVLARNGMIVLVSSTAAPYTDSCEVVRERHGRSGTHFLHVHMTTSTATSAQSEVNGLPYAPDLVIRPSAPTTSKPASLLLGLLAEKRFVVGAA